MHERPLVVFSGGGTGGHLYPALAIADELRSLRPDVRVLFIGAERGIEARVLPERDIDHVLLPVRGFDRSRPLSALAVAAGLVTSVRRVARSFADDRPEVVVVTGGYAGASAGLVAAMHGVPLVLQEQNSVPGVVTRVLSRWASRVHAAFPEVADHLHTPPERIVLSGNPVRVPTVRDRAVARATFGLPSDATVVLVAGGSQGSLALNRVLGEVVRAVGAGELRRPDDVHLLWATGPSHYDSVSRVLTESGEQSWVHVVPYIDDMPSALEAADVAVGRAGAMSTAELVNQGLPAILVPFPYAAADHQTLNARSLERAGVAVALAEADLSGERLWQELTGLLASPARLASMKESAAALARPSAATDIAADVASLIGRAS